MVNAWNEHLRVGNNLELYRLFMDTKFEVVSSDID